MDIPTVTEALDLFRSRDLGPVELLEGVLNRIDELDDTLGAYATVDRDAALEAARSAERSWAAQGSPAALCGVPLSVKDNYDIEGSVTGCGSRQREGVDEAKADAAVVYAAKKAGAVLTGKVKLHELALGITGENDWAGTPRNPHDHGRLPGGSSSGSAVSVAAGLALASIGSDTGGSIRVPAALCGVVGLKPSFGWTSRSGLFPLSDTMDHPGLICRTVADAKLLLTVLRETPIHLVGANRRVGLLLDLQRAAAPSVRARIADVLESLPFDVDEASFPAVLDAPDIYTRILLVEALSIHRRALETSPERFGEDLRAMLARGAAISRADFKQALDERRSFASACKKLFARFDALVTPTTLVTAPKRGESELEIDGRRVSVRDALLGATCPFSMIGLPAASVPVGQDESGLPIGLQVVGRAGEEDLVLEVAESIELVAGLSED